MPQQQKQSPSDGVAAAAAGAAASCRAHAPCCCGSPGVLRRRRWRRQQGARQVVIKPAQTTAAPSNAQPPPDGGCAQPGTANDSPQPAGGFSTRLDTQPSPNLVTPGVALDTMRRPNAGPAFLCRQVRNFWELPTAQWQCQWGDTAGHMHF